MIADRRGSGGGAREIVRHLQDSRSLSFMEAIKLLAGLTSVALPSREMTPEQIEVLKKERRRGEIYEEVFYWSQRQLQADNAGAKEMREYILETRGLPADKILLPSEELDPLNPKLELGYIPDQDSMRDHLRSLDFTEEEIGTYCLD